MDIGEHDGGGLVRACRLRHDQPVALVALAAVDAEFVSIVRVVGQFRLLREPRCPRKYQPVIGQLRFLGQSVL